MRPLKEIDQTTYLTVGALLGAFGSALSEKPRSNAKIRRLGLFTLVGMGLGSLIHKIEPEGSSVKLGRIAPGPQDDSSGKNSGSNSSNTMKLPEGVILAKGSKDPKNVALLQAMLNKLKCGPVVTDGIFGNDTRDAVIAFQSKYNLAMDGIVGTVTLAVLNDALENPRKYAKTLATAKNNAKGSSNSTDKDPSDPTKKKRKIIMPTVERV